MVCNISGVSLWFCEEFCELIDWCNFFPIPSSLQYLFFFVFVFNHNHSVSSITEGFGGTSLRNYVKFTENIWLKKSLLFCRYIHAQGVNVHAHMREPQCKMNIKFLTKYEYKYILKRKYLLMQISRIRIYLCYALSVFVSCILKVVHKSYGLITLWIKNSVFTSLSKWNNT